MDELTTLAQRAAELLVSRDETVAIGESSTGGRIAAALLAVAGASAYFRGGAVAYTRDAKMRLLGVAEADMVSHRPATPEHALVLARAARGRLNATWGIGETGAAGPTGNRYGDPAGHTCVGVAGLAERTITLRTEQTDRQVNMDRFSVAALRLLVDSLEAADAVSSRTHGT